MQLLFPIAFRQFLNNIESLEPVIQLYDLHIQYDTATQSSVETRRYTNNNEQVVYFSNTYEPIAINMGDVSEGSVNEPATGIPADVSNIDSTVSNLTEQYWVSVLSGERLWVVTMYLVQPSNPEGTPPGTGIQFQIDQITTTYTQAQFTLSMLNPAQTLKTPRRSYARRYGFPIPGRP